MNKRNVLAVLSGILFCVNIGSPIKFKQDLMQKNLASLSTSEIKKRSQFNSYTKQVVEIKVRKGWSLSKIANGLGTNIKHLLTLNKIKNPDLIYAGQTIKVIPYNKVKKVKVSWYGPRFHRKKMSNGKIFNMECPNIAAHKLLPFKTKVRLTRLDNKKSIVVVVQDRGPYVQGRDFDISRKAAEHLGIIKSGIALCEVKILN